eukprot:jgi/Botrbrau1/5244/Bobra.0172s0106.1
MTYMPVNWRSSAVQMIPANVENIIAEGRLSDVAGLLDAAALQDSRHSFSDDWPFSLHMLAQIHNNELEDARFIHKQASPAVQQGSQVVAVFNVLQALWNYDYEGVWQALNHEWPDELKALADGVVTNLRLRFSTLISRSYSHIRVSKAASLLGLTIPETLAWAASKGWEHDSQSQLLKVKREGDAGKDRTTVEHLHRLTEYAVHLSTT